MKRKAWLDYMKFIAMFLVVVYHTPPRYDNAHESALFNVGTPVFFFAAGYVFNIAKQKNFFAFALHRARQILVPYTTFFIIFYALWLMVGRRLAGPEEMAIDTLTPLWHFFTGRPEIVVGPFWFLACLLVMQLVYYPIKRLLPGYWPLVAAFAISLIGLLDAFPDIRFWNIGRAMLYLPVYAVGNCCHKQIERFTFDTAPRTLLWLALAAIALCFLVIAPLHLDRDLSYVLAPEAVIMMLPAITATCRLLEQRFGTSRVAQNVAVTGITYLALQNYLIGIIKMLVAKFAGPDIFDDNFVLKVAIAVIVMIILYPIALFIERYLPFLLGKPCKRSKS